MRQRIKIKCSTCGSIMGTKMGIANTKGSADQYLCIQCSNFTITRKLDKPDNKNQLHTNS